MHSIFTRVFVSFWAAILLIAAAAVAITTLNFATDARNPHVITRRAADVLEREGMDGLRTWLAERNARHPRQRTLVVDEAGRDILGQPLPRFRRHGPRGFPRAPPGAAIRGADGARFVVLFDPPPRRGPFSPPFSWPVRGILLALAVAISGLVSYLLARTISSPLRELQMAARRLSTGALDARTSTGIARRRDELGSLAREFDAMAERLGALIGARQQLLRDISHELRSPLARLRMALGLARQDSSSAAAQLDRIEREAERLEELIANILAYARLERDPVTLALEEVDLIELVRQIVHDAEFESQSPQGRLRFVHTAEITLRADAQLLHAAIDNVVRNALLHTGSDAPIDIAIAADADAVRISVRDRGPGVPDSELERIFEPFHRAPAAAPTAASVDGTGIGLAITARAIALHGGRVTAQNAPDGGLEITISLPLRTADRGAGAAAS